MSFLDGKSEIKRNPIAYFDWLTQGHGSRVVRIQIDECSVTLTPFGSLSRMNPIGVNGARKSWRAKLRMVLAFLFR
jgi:hypothetical protein